MESIPSSSKTSANSDASPSSTETSDWARLRNAVADPVPEIIAVEVDTEAHARDIVSGLLALDSGRPSQLIEFDSLKSEPSELLESARIAAAQWSAERGLLCLLDTSRPQRSEDDLQATVFWQTMNMLREHWDELRCQTVFLLLPFNYRLLSSSADHLKRWIALKVHLMGDPLEMGAPAENTFLSLVDPNEAKNTLHLLEVQLAEAIKRGEPSATFGRRYYMPMFAQAVSLGDIVRAESLQKKIESTDGLKEELPGWFNVSFYFELDRFNITQARQIAQRHLETAQEQGNLSEEANALHNLGRAAEASRDFSAANSWYLQSLGIEERQGYEHEAAATYHQLGTLAQQQRDYAGAERWYLKSLAIKEKQGNEHGAAITYHQLAMIAQQQRDYAGAEHWYLKSLAITEKQGDERAAARTYHQLGIIAEEQRDYAGAERWYLKSVAIKEKHGDEHGAATTYYQLGVVAFMQKDFADAGRFSIKAYATLRAKNDPHSAGIVERQLVRVLREAPTEIGDQLRQAAQIALGKEAMAELEKAVVQAGGQPTT